MLRTSQLSLSKDRDSYRSYVERVDGIRSLRALSSWIPSTCTLLKSSHWPFDISPARVESVDRRRAYDVLREQKSGDVALPRIINLAWKGWHVREHDCAWSQHHVSYRVLTDQQAAPYKRSPLAPRSDASSHSQALLHPTQVTDTFPPPHALHFNEAHVHTGDTVRLLLGAAPSSAKEYAIKRGQSQSLASIGLPKPGSHLLNTGRPILSLDWCPLRSDCSRLRSRTSCSLCPLHGTLSWAIAEEYLAISCASSSERKYFGRPAPPSPSSFPASSTDSFSVESVPDNTAQPQQAEAEQTTSCVQIWNVGANKEGGEAKLSLLVCFAEGEQAGQQAEKKGARKAQRGDAIQIEWCPVAHHTSKRLGLLGCLFENGRWEVYDVPHPLLVQPLSAGKKEKEPCAVTLQPIFGASLRSDLFTCFAWGGQERVAMGCASGHVAVYGVGDALRCESASCRPSHYVEASEGPVTTLSFRMLPPLQTSLDEGEEGAEESTRLYVEKEDALPSVLFAGGMDGCVRLMDLDALPGGRVNLHHYRNLNHCSTFSPHFGSFVCDKVEGDTLTLVNMRALGYGSQKSLLRASGPFQTVKASYNHPLVAAGSANGGVYLFNLVRVAATRGPNKANVLLFRLEVNRSTGELRMLDDFLPRAFAEEGHGSSWMPCIGVQSVAWSPNVGRATLLASGTGTGLVRIDWCAPSQSAGHPVFD
ncbi:hypothetical protein IE81DRAFT_320765 [Ceraceosorus guamensis]|uniref:WD40 repeat-like protein n=1 Tax=Ceraceosorus guamensis TaxID=1522189 RepID=A0A316W9X5_9BASI|nr:hypothetical protein IE81DRAFT_320765 [Ceraceosorus guamensis]PWN44803.1 hypothetical protein IE81DRAFT_320765 [Ceraceosorus guamensis]